MTLRYIGPRVTNLAVIIVLLSSMLATPATAQSGSTGTSSDPCSGMSPGSAWICDGFMGIVEWFIGGMQDIVQGLFTGVVEFIVDTPAPYRNGEMAFFEAPDNAPWARLYDLYLTKTLPIGIGLWALIVILVQFTRLFTHTAQGEYERTRLMRRAAFSLLLLIAWWPVGAFVLHMAGSLTSAIAPSGSQMAGTVNEFFSNIGGGMITALLLYFSSGVLAFLLLLVFLARHVAIYVLMPLMPVLIPLWIIDEGPMKYIAGVAETIGGMFVPFVFMTVPTAAILLVGYSIQGALQLSMSPIGVIPGVSGTETSAYALILFVFWMMALIAPLFVLFGGRAGLPLAYLTAGYVAGRGMRGVTRGGVRGLRSAGASTSAVGASSSTAAPSPTMSSLSETGLPELSRPAALDPMFSDARHGSVGAGGPPGPLVGIHGSTGTDAGFGFPGSDSGQGGGWGGRPWDSVRGGISSPHVKDRITPENGFDEVLPGDRRFSFGYSRDGEFQHIGPQDQLTKEDVVDQKYPNLANTRLYTDKPDMYLRDDHGDLYDVTPQWHYDLQHTRFDEEARDVVYRAQDYDSAAVDERFDRNRSTKE